MKKKIPASEPTPSKRTTERREFARLASELAEPLAKFLDHPLMIESVAGEIVDALLELADLERPPASHSELAMNSLKDIATHLSK